MSGGRLQNGNLQPDNAVDNVRGCETSRFALPGHRSVLYDLPPRMLELLRSLLGALCPLLPPFRRLTHPHTHTV